MSFSRNFELSIVKVAAGVGTVGAVISMIFGFKMFGLGLLLGVLASSTNFLLISTSVRQAVKLPPSKASWIGVTGYFSRLLFSAIILIAAAYTRDFGFFIGTVAGLFVIKFVLMLFSLTGKA